MSGNYPDSPDTGTNTTQRRPALTRTPGTCRLAENSRGSALGARAPLIYPHRNSLLRTRFGLRPQPPNRALICPYLSACLLLTVSEKGKAGNEPQPSRNYAAHTHAIATPRTSDSCTCGYQTHSTLVGSLYRNY
jgi:hypothetical protein